MEKQQNKWEQLFEQFMDLTEFSLIKNKNPRLVLRYKDPDGNPVEEVHEGIWSIYDCQGANLGDIESDRFDNAKQIFERMDIYINDYIYRDLEEEIDAYEVDLEGRELPWSAETWLALRNDQEFCKKYNKFFDDHKFEFDILDMICNHYEEIDLNNVYLEEEE